MSFSSEFKCIGHQVHQHLFDPHNIHLYQVSLESRVNINYKFGGSFMVQLEGKQVFYLIHNLFDEKGLPTNEKIIVICLHFGKIKDVVDHVVEEFEGAHGHGEGSMVLVVSLGKDGLQIGQESSDGVDGGPEFMGHIRQHLLLTPGLRLLLLQQLHIAHIHHHVHQSRHCVPVCHERLYLVDLSGSACESAPQSLVLHL